MPVLIFLQNNAYSVDECTGGRPSIEIDMDKVKELRGLGFKFVDIAKMLNISRSTLYRSLGNSDLMGYTDISDQELDRLILDYKDTHPNDGEVMVIGHIRACNLSIP